MAKDLLFRESAREKMKEGVLKLSRAVKVTLGPRGRNAILDKSWGSPTVTKDGATVADEIELQDPAEKVGALVAKEAASKTSDVTGDGTTTATVLTESIFLEGLKNVTAGANVASLVRGIRKGVDVVVDELKKMSKEVKERSQITQVATVAANNDAEIGRMISDAMEKVGRDGVITVEEGKGLETEVKVVEGMQFDRGFLSPYFVTDQDAMEAVLENAYVLVYEEKISAVKDVVPLLEALAREKKPLLIIAEDVEGEALATLVVNKMKGICQVCAVKAPGYGERRKAMMQDIAILTGGKAIFKDLGIKLENVTLSDLGRAKKIVVDNDTTTIMEGAGDPAAIEARVEQIRREIEETTSDYDREKLQERLAKLTGGIAQIRVGAPTESDMKEKKTRVEGALEATKAAVEEGILPGGGVALVRAAAALDKVKVSDEDEKVGLGILRKALDAPLKQIVENAGLDGAVVAKKVREGKGTYGFDVVKEEFVDMMEAGIMDACKVVRVALQNAASAATMLLMTDCVVTTIPEKKKKNEPGDMDEFGDEF